MSDIRSASDQRYIYFPHLDFFYCDSHSLFPFLSIHGNGHVSDCPISSLLLGSPNRNGLFLSLPFFGQNHSFLMPC